MPKAKDTTKPVYEEKEKKEKNNNAPQEQSLQVKSTQSALTVVEKKREQIVTEQKKEPAKEKIDIVKKIVELHNEGIGASKIGIILRDKYKVRNLKKATGKTVLQVLESQKLAPELPEDLVSLLNNSIKLQKHMKTNKKDFSAKRGYQKTVSRIRRLAKYYKRTDKLPRNWNYSEEEATVLVK